MSLQSARQQLSEVRMADLRFDQQEARAFLHERWLLPVPEYLVQTIAHYTEGWAVGLQLVALVGLDHMAQQTQALLQQLHESTAFILDYLAEEVFLRFRSTCDGVLKVDKCAIAHLTEYCLRRWLCDDVFR